MPIFKACEPRCIAILVQSLKGQIYLPTEQIIQQGEIGYALFFIRMGEVQVCGGGPR